MSFFYDSSSFSRTPDFVRSAVIFSISLTSAFSSSAYFMSAAGMLPTRLYDDGFRSASFDSTLLMLPSFIGDDVLDIAGGCFTSDFFVFDLSLLLLTGDTVLPVFPILSSATISLFSLKNL